MWFWFRVQLNWFYPYSFPFKVTLTIKCKSLENESLYRILLGDLADMMPALGFDRSFAKLMRVVFFATDLSLQYKQIKR